MRFSETPLHGAWVVEPEPIADERGWFARTYDADEFERRGLASVGVQCNASFNERADTLRGLHYQREPHAEPKLVRCVAGSVWDVAVDLRPESPSYLAWHGIELSAENGLSYFIPAGCAHGFQTLSPRSQVLYMMGERYSPDDAAGVRWDDPAFGIRWPEPRGQRLISDRDRTFPDHSP